MLLPACLLCWHAARRKGKKYREGRRKGSKNKGRKMLKDKAPQALQELEAGNYHRGNHHHGDYHHGNWGEGGGLQWVVGGGLRKETDIPGA